MLESHQRKFARDSSAFSIAANNNLSEPHIYSTPLEAIMADELENVSRETIRLWRIYRTTREMLNDRVCYRQTVTHRSQN